MILDISTEKNKNSVNNFKQGLQSFELEKLDNLKLSATYSVDSIKRTVHLAFHGLFSLLKILFTISKQYF